MSLLQNDLLGLSFRFLVVVDGYSLGSWSTCKGLGVTFKHEAVKELGQHAYTSLVPGRAEYSAVTLQRAMKQGDWLTTKTWLEQVVSDAWLVGMDSPHTATITLRDAKNTDVATWTLRNALPSSWKGPQLDSSGKGIALETLDIVHEGFLDD